MLTADQAVCIHLTFAEGDEDRCVSPPPRWPDSLNNPVCSRGIPPPTTPNLSCVYQLCGVYEVAFCHIIKSALR